MDVMMIQGEARQAVMEALRGSGYAPVVENSLVTAWGREGSQCNACCAGRHASAALAELHRRSGSRRSLHRFVIAAIEKPLIESVLERTGGNQVAAARILGINRNTLRARISEYDIRVPGH